MNPIGRQCASGLSLLLSAILISTRSAAHGCSGRPSLKPEPAFPNVASGTSSSDASGGAGAAPLAPAPPGIRMFCQTPDMSGLPSAILGVDAVAGVAAPADDCGHCADSNADIATTRHIEPAALNRIIPILPTSQPFVSRYFFFSSCSLSF